MTTSGFAVHVAGALFGLVGPLAAAHYERAPSERLDPRLAAAIALGSSLVLAALLYRHASVPSPSLFGFGWGVALGAAVGLTGVGIYGLLDRLVLPALDRRRSE